MDIKDFVSRLQNRQFPIAWPGHFIHGAWRPSSKGPLQKASQNPNTGDTLLETSFDKDSVARVIEFAVNAKQAIGAIPVAERLEYLQRFRQALADHQDTAELILRIEAGKPHWEAREDFDGAIKYLDNVVATGERIFDSLLGPARIGKSQGEFVLLPIGVTIAYLPFSTPLTTFVLYFSASVIAGCPLILSSSSHAMLTSMLVGFLAQNLDLPPSLLNIIFGNFNSFKQAMGDKRVAAILYTGSREHCDTIRGEAKFQLGRQVVLQSGGKNAVIVHSSADLEQAVKCVVYGALKSAGQRCTSTSRVFVYRSLLSEFRERLCDAFKNVRIGRTDLDYEDPSQAPYLGPLYSKKAIEKYLRFQTMANREADKTLLWGKAVEITAGGFFVTPSLHYLTKFDNSSAYQGNVLFSPDVAIYDYDVLEQAIEHINTTDAAFAVSFIGDPEIIEARRQLFFAPNLLVNMPTVEIDATLPLAGRLQSGHHRFHGPGIALYLCYPQVLERSDGNPELLRSWPWPHF